MVNLESLQPGMFAGMSVIPLLPLFFFPLFLFFPFFPCLSLFFFFHSLCFPFFFLLPLSFFAPFPFFILFSPFFPPPLLFFPLFLSFSLFFSPFFLFEAVFSSPTPTPLWADSLERSSHPYSGGRWIYSCGSWVLWRGASAPKELQPSTGFCCVCAYVCVCVFFNSSEHSSLVFPTRHYGLWMNKHKDIQATFKKKKPSTISNLLIQSWLCGAQRCVIYPITEFPFWLFTSL